MEDRKMKFRDIKIGDTFDWIEDGSHYNSFYLRCRKISTRKYSDERGVIHIVGTINATVYHHEVCWGAFPLTVGNPIALRGK
jgi:hypothetical protein